MKFPFRSVLETEYRSSWLSAGINFNASKPAAGPFTCATTTARLTRTTGVGCFSISRSYNERMCAQLVSVNCSVVA